MHKGVLLFGYPGSGKGTQGKVLAAMPGFHHVAMGDIFRALGPENPLYAQVRRHIDAGDLVPDALVIELFAQNVAARNIPEHEMIVVDGLPRNVDQVELLKKHIDVIKIFKLSVYDERVVMDRLIKRSAKERRSDDTETIIQHRLDVYRTQTEACIRHYPGSILTRIQANQPVFDVHLDIVHSLHKMRNIQFL
jgi:adenylate kinase